MLKNSFTLIIVVVGLEERFLNYIFLWHFTLHSQTVPHNEFRDSPSKEHLNQNNHNHHRQANVATLITPPEEFQVHVYINREYDVLVPIY